MMWQSSTSNSTKQFSKVTNLELEAGTNGNLCPKNSLEPMIIPREAFIVKILSATGRQNASFISSMYNVPHYLGGAKDESENY